MWNCSLEYWNITVESSGIGLIIRVSDTIRERVAKPLKNGVLTKERNRLSVEHADMQLRAGLNLRFLLEARKAIMG